MKNLTELIEAAKSEAKKHGYNSKVLEASINEGLIEGDEIQIAPGTRVKIIGGKITTIGENSNGMAIPIESAPAAMIEKALILKAVQKSHIGSSVGTL